MPGLAVPDAEELTKGMDMLETHIDRWEAQAIAKGMLQGMQQGEAWLLQRHLTRRFSPLPAARLASLATATPAQLETWGDRVLDATSLDEVFGETRH